MNGGFLFFLYFSWPPESGGAVFRFIERSHRGEVVVLLCRCTLSLKCAAQRFDWVSLKWPENICSRENGSGRDTGVRRGSCLSLLCFWNYKKNSVPCAWYSTVCGRDLVAVHSPCFSMCCSQRQNGFIHDLSYEITQTIRSIFFFLFNFLKTNSQNVSWEGQRTLTVGEQLWRSSWSQRARFLLFSKDNTNSLDLCFSLHWNTKLLCCKVN